MRKLKVYRSSTEVFRSKSVEVIVATTSFKRVAEIMKQSLYGIRTYWCVTGNVIDIAAAMEHPEEPLYTERMYNKDRVYKKWNERFNETAEAGNA